MSIKNKKWKLPVNYNELEQRERRTVRLQYIEEQQNLCQYCKMPLNEAPINYVEVAMISWAAFPMNFQLSPIHLHHNHETGMTIGAVHMKCNAYLWQYKGE